MQCNCYALDLLGFGEGKHLIPYKIRGLPQEGIIIKKQSNTTIEIEFEEEILEDTLEQKIR